MHPNFKEKKGKEPKVCERTPGDLSCSPKWLENYQKTKIENQSGSLEVGFENLPTILHQHSWKKWFRLRDPVFEEYFSKCFRYFPQFFGVFFRVFPAYFSEFLGVFFRVIRSIFQSFSEYFSDFFRVFLRIFSVFFGIF